MSRLNNKQRWGLASAILLTLLLAAVFTFGSLNVPFEPKSWRAVMALYAVSSFITAAFLVLAHPRAHHSAALGGTQKGTTRRPL